MHQMAEKLSAVQSGHTFVSDSLWPHGPQHASPPCPPPTAGVTQTHVHWVGDAIQPSHPLSSPSPPTFNLSQHQSESEKWKMKLCPTLCDPVDCSLPDSSIHGILQVRILEWVAFPSPGDLPDPGIELGSPTLQADALTSEPPSFQMSQFFTSGGQSIGVSTSASVLPMNIQDWFHLGWTGWISLLSKGLSRVFSNTTIQKHQFFSTHSAIFIVQLSYPYMTTGRTIALTRQPLCLLFGNSLSSGSEKAMAPHSNILAWKIPWTEEPGRLQSMGLWRVRHDWATSL